MEARPPNHGHRHQRSTKLKVGSRPGPVSRRLALRSGGTSDYDSRRRAELLQRIYGRGIHRATRTAHRSAPKNSSPARIIAAGKPADEVNWRTQIRKVLNAVFSRYNYALVHRQRLFDWQISDPLPSCSSSLTLPHDATIYLQRDNPLLQQLQARYAKVEVNVTEPPLWSDSLVSGDDLLHFRGDNAYVWQLRGPNMNAVGYALAAYYVKSIDTLRLLDRLEEDELFGAHAFRIDGRLVSRDLLDSIIEIYFLETHLQLSEREKLTVLDIGAGYGRLAHRMLLALPNLKRYLCADAVATSSFISDYYLRFRGLGDKAKVVVLDELDHTLQLHSVDIAINVHSFSECSISAIDWWLALLAKHCVRYLMIVPNIRDGREDSLQTNRGEEFGSLIAKHGYRLFARNPKYRDPVVQRYAINPTFHYLFERP